MKLTSGQIDMLWGETGPYSEASLKKQVRVLDDSVSRIFLEVQNLVMYLALFQVNIEIRKY